MTADVYSTDGYFAVIPEVILDAPISANAVRLYAVLRRYADQRTGHAHPGRKTLATRMRVANVKTVDRALAELEALGVVETFARFMGPSGSISRVKNADYPEQTSNGYIVRGDIRGQGGPTSGTTPRPSDGTGVAPPEGHKPEPLEPEPLEPDGAPTPQASEDVPATSGGVEFEEFWKRYPKRVGKGQALKAYRAARKKASAETILEAVTKFPFERDRPQFIPYPATWLNGERWQDESAPMSTDRSSSGGLWDAGRLYG